jgi:hypothetical protein
VIEAGKAQGKRQAIAEKDARERELQRVRTQAIREKEEAKRRKQRRRASRDRQQRLVQLGRRLAGIVGVGSRQDLRP